MKTTLEIPTDIYRQAKIRAATDGRKIKDLVTEGLVAVLQQETVPAVAESPASAYDVMRGACGCAASGVPDLATNPKHMKGFGRA